MKRVRISGFTDFSEIQEDLNKLAPWEGLSVSNINNECVIKYGPEVDVQRIIDYFQGRVVATLFDPQLERARKKLKAKQSLREFYQPLLLHLASHNAAGVATIQLEGVNDTGVGGNGFTMICQPEGIIKLTIHL